VTSFAGNITLNCDGKPVVHAHCVVALLRNGTVHAAHFLEGHVSVTMQMNLVDAKTLAPAASASR
jgi:predicted DNA-binding protein with PD1-like motif